MTKRSPFEILDAAYKNFKASGHEYDAGFKGGLLAARDLFLPPKGRGSNPFAPGEAEASHARARAAVEAALQSPSLKKARQRYAAKVARKIKRPNAKTIAAMKELNAGKGKRAKGVRSLLKKDRKS